MRRYRIYRGFTLVELSVAIMLGMAIGTMILSIFNQQLAFLQIYRAQNFLTEEAPIISMHVGKLINRADRFRLHESVSDALAERNSTLGPAPVVMLSYNQPDGTVRLSMLSFEDRGHGNALYYYLIPNTGVVGDPQMAISTQPQNVSFTLEDGVLRMTLDGPAGERITYSGTMQL